MLMLRFVLPLLLCGCFMPPGHADDSGQFYAPHGIAINSQGEIFVLDSYNTSCAEFRNEGEVMPSADFNQ